MGYTRAATFNGKSGVPFIFAASLFFFCQESLCRHPYLLLTGMVSYLVATAPLPEIRTVKANIRFPLLVYKKNVYNVLTPVTFLTIAVVCLGLSLLL